MVVELELEVGIWRAYENGVEATVLKIALNRKLLSFHSQEIGARNIRDNLSLTIMY